MGLRRPSLSLLLASLLGLSSFACSLNRNGLGDDPNPAIDASADTSLSDADAHSDAAKDATEAGFDAPHEASEAEACVGETDEALCSSVNIECGLITTVDSCGTDRNVDCGGCSPPDTCGGGGVEHACGSWWECAWAYRQPVVVKATVATEPGYAVSVTVDHASLVSAGKALANGDDLRVVYRSGTAWVEVDRVLDPDSAWNTPSTKLWFAVQGKVWGGTQSRAHFIYYGNPNAAPPPADEAKVFLFADFFNRADSTDPGNGWTLAEDQGTAIDIQGGMLWFTTCADKPNRPAADHPFPGTASPLEFRFGMVWKRTGAETNYRVHAQLGLASLMVSPPPVEDVWSFAGVGPSIVWAGTSQGMTDQEALGYEVAGVAHQLGVVSGSATVSTIVSPADKKFSLTVSGNQLGSDLPFSAAVGSFDRIRLMSWQLNEAYFASRGFDHVIVRPVDSPEPSCSRDPEEPATCQP